MRSLDPQRDLMDQARPFLQQGPDGSFNPKDPPMLADSGEDFGTMLRMLCGTSGPLGKLKAGRESHLSPRMWDGNLPAPRSGHQPGGLCNCPGGP